MPPVIEPETFGSDDDQAPTVVWIPTAREWHGDDDGPAIELRLLEEGALAVLAYTSLDALGRGCGNGQPYIEVLPQAMDELLHATGAEVVIWDAVLDPAIRHGVLADDDGEES